MEVVDVWGIENTEAIQNSDQRLDFSARWGHKLQQSVDSWSAYCLFNIINVKFFQNLQIDILNFHYWNQKYNHDFVTT